MQQYYEQLMGVPYFTSNYGMLHQQPKEIVDNPNRKRYQKRYEDSDDEENQKPYNDSEENEVKKPKLRPNIKDTNKKSNVIFLDSSEEEEEKPKSKPKTLKERFAENNKNSIKLFLFTF